MYALRFQGQVRDLPLFLSWAREQKRRHVAALEQFRSDGTLRFRGVMVTDAKICEGAANGEKGHAATAPNVYAQGE